MPRHDSMYLVVSRLEAAPTGGVMCTGGYPPTPPVGVASCRDMAWWCPGGKPHLQVVDVHRRLLAPPPVGVTSCRDMAGCTWWCLGWKPHPQVVDVHRRLLAPASCRSGILSRHGWMHLVVSRLEAASTGG